MPNVYNKRNTYPADAVYVGRPTQWGNPFKVGRDGTRDEVIKQFEGYAYQMLKQKPDWLVPLRGKDLLCWCFPEACHADVLVRLANQKLRYFSVRSNRVTQFGLRECLCQGFLHADGSIYLTWTGNMIINQETRERDRVQLQKRYDTMETLLVELASQNIRCIVWKDTGEYEFINKE